MHKLRTHYQEKPSFDNKAYTITSTFHDGTLKSFTSHPTPPTVPGSRPTYVMSQLNSWAMTGNLETCREGVAAFRNARDWAKEQRGEAIGQANEGSSDSQSTVVIDANSEQVCSFICVSSADRPSTFERTCELSGLKISLQLPTSKFATHCRLSLH